MRGDDLSILSQLLPAIVRDAGQVLEADLSILSQLLLFRDAKVAVEMDYAFNSFPVAASVIRTAVYAKSARLSILSQLLRE
jgi:branched-subunit amino acid transport protein AzlD